MTTFMYMKDKNVKATCFQSHMTNYKMHYSVTAKSLHLVIIVMTSLQLRTELKKEGKFPLHLAMTHGIV